MANDSVGKISLDLEIQSDINGQIEAVTSKIGGQIEKSLKKVSGAVDAEKMMQNMHQEIEALMQNISRVIEAALKRCTESAKMNIDIIGDHLNAMIDRAMARITNVLNPYSQTEEPAATGDTKARPIQPRAPPVVKVKAPAIKIDYTKDMLESQMEQIDQVTMNIGKQIDLQEAKLAELKAAYERTFNDAKKNRIQEQILKTEGSIISLKGKLQDLGFQYDALERKAALIKAPATATVQAPASVSAAPKIAGMANISSALSKIQTVRSGISGLLRTIGSGLVSGAKTAASAVGRLFQTIGSGIPKILKAGSALSIFGNRTKKAGKQSQSAQGGMHRMLTTMLRYQIIIPIIMSALRGMAKSLFASMNANEQFKASLSQIRSNLNVAFTPIYQAVMPALNALMSALARVTGYIAAFVSLLFGKTLSGSVAATKSLVAAKTAMGAYGDSAKKAAKDAQGLTTGIDELNILQANKDDSGGGGGGEAPEITAPDIDTTQMGLIDTMAEKVKSVLGQLFKPMKDSWEAEGQSVINAAQYAFGNVIGLAQAMGRSFLEVWTNGTGERFCTNILRLVTLVFNVVGDIAGAFKRAWEEGGRGDAVIQSIFDRLNSWLELIHTIGESFRDVWNNGTGESMIGHILDSFTQINDTITHIRDNFRKAWELDGTGTAVIQNLADILDGLLGTVDRITKSLSDWSSKLDFAPILTAFERMTKALKPLGDKLGSGLELLFKNVLQPLGKWALEEAIPAALDGIAEALGLLNSVLDSLKPAGEWLWKNLLEPMGKWVGTALVDDLRGISDALKTVNDVLSGTSQLNPKEIFDNLMGGISRFNPLKPMMDLGKAIVDGIIEGIKSRDIMAGVRAAFESFLASVKDFFGIHSPSTVFAEIGDYLIKGLLNGIVGGWSGLIESIQDLPGQLTELFRSGYEGVQNIFSGIGDWFDGKWGEVKTALAGVPSWFSEKFTSARTKVSESFQSIGSWFSERYTDVTTAFRNSPTWFKNTFNDAYKKLTGVIQPIGGWFSGRYQDVQNAFKDSPIWFQSTFQSAYDNLTTAVSPIGGWFSDRYVDVQKAFEKSPEWFKTTFDNAYKNITSIFEPIKKFFEDIGEAIRLAFKGALNGVIDLFNQLIGWINEKMHISFDGLEVAGQEIIPGFDIQLFRLPIIDKLAQGGYVGANQPQLAMIGDNRHYGEIVAPEDKMQAMVDKAVAMAARPDGMSEQYLIIMIDLLKKIIELIENLDLTVNIDIREIKKKLVDLEKRSGLTLRTT
ncbi:hypothetical protein [Hungatella sp. SL.1.14]|uniref:phage tail protein n=1 Tax=Hungatella sp. SL.1.14 TaxID=2963703 RepID=UPI00210A485E|nr:hypothetical protein [Hungatella sp. SL.1.14]MCQ4833045.1 hypothetical protein [Hungatella sp. SL.1.14]